MGQFGRSRVQECNKAPSEIEITRKFVSVLTRAKAKKLKPFVALQQFERSECLLLRVHMIKIIDMIAWNGKLIPCLYQNNWTLLNTKYYPKS